MLCSGAAEPLRVVATPSGGRLRYFRVFSTQFDEVTAALLIGSATSLRSGLRARLCEDFRSGCAPDFVRTSSNLIKIRVVLRSVTRLQVQFAF